MEVKIEAEVEEVEIIGVGTANFVGLPVNAHSSQNPSCETCRFFVKDSHQFEDEPTLGSCHRNAPTNRDAYRLWPGVNGTLWCGEYEQSLTPLPDAVAP